MRGVGADEARLAGRRVGEQIAADVARRQAERAQARRSADGRSPGRRRGARPSTRVTGVVMFVADGIEAELGVDAVHQIDRAASSGRARRETTSRANASSSGASGT